MRRSASLIIPLSLILMYYAFWIVLVWFLLRRFPILNDFFPIGGVDDLAASNVDSFVWVPEVGTCQGVSKVLDWPG